jgi:hypothetical protein
VAELSPEEAAGEAEVAQKAVSERPDEDVLDPEAEVNPTGEPKQD